MTKVQSPVGVVTNRADALVALCNQSATIYMAIGRASYVDDLVEALTLLDYSSPLWKVLGYEYKARELLTWLKKRAMELRDKATDVITTCRRNSGQWNSWIREINNLDALLSGLNDRSSEEN